MAWNSISELRAWTESKQGSRKGAGLQDQDGRDEQQEGHGRHVAQQVQAVHLVRLVRQQHPLRTQLPSYRAWAALHCSGLKPWRVASSRSTGHCHIVDRHVKHSWVFHACQGVLEEVRDANPPGCSSGSWPDDREQCRLGVQVADMCVFLMYAKPADCSGCLLSAVSW